LKKILFRADAAPHIGIGDLMSLINISKYFDEEDEKYFIIKNFNAGLNLIKKYNVPNCFVIDNNISREDEVLYINDFINDNKIDFLFLEITEVKLSSYIGLTQRVKKICVNFDEHILDDLDLVIDWDVEAQKFFDTEKYPQTKFLLGPEYVILPKEFYSKKVEIRNNTLSNKKILIAMGGADELNFTEKIIDCIMDSNLKYEVTVIIGSGYEYKNKLEIKLQKSDLTYSIKQNISNMIGEYLDCDIGIGAGGLTSSELVATKVSPILIATYKHQVARCQYFSDMGWARYLGYREFKNDELIDSILDPIKPRNISIFNTKVIVDEIGKI